MKATTKRLLALVLVLCTMLALGMRTVPYAQAAEELPEGIVYGAADQTTFVPAGYTYVFEDENGMGYTYEAEGDMYISERVLTAEEAEALAKLDCRGDSMWQPDGTVCKTFSAKEAAPIPRPCKDSLWRSGGGGYIPFPSGWRPMGKPSRYR